MFCSCDVMFHAMFFLLSSGLLCYVLCSGMFRLLICYCYVLCCYVIVMTCYGMVCSVLCVMVVV